MHPPRTLGANRARATAGGTWVRICLWTSRLDPARLVGYWTGWGAAPELCAPWLSAPTSHDPRDPAHRPSNTRRLPRWSSFGGGGLVDPHGGRQRTRAPAGVRPRSPCATATTAPPRPRPPVPGIRTRPPSRGSGARAPPTPRPRAAWGFWGRSAATATGPAAPAPRAAAGAAPRLRGGAAWAPGPGG